MPNGDGLTFGFFAVKVLPLKILGDNPGVRPLILMKFGGLTLCISVRILVFSGEMESICIIMGLLSGLLVLFSVLLPLSYSRATVISFSKSSYIFIVSYVLLSFYISTVWFVRSISLDSSTCLIILRGDSFLSIISLIVDWFSWFLRGLPEWFTKD